MLKKGHLAVGLLAILALGGCKARSYHLEPEDENSGAEAQGQSKVPLPPTSRPAVGGFIERTVFATGTSEDVSDKPVICTAAFRFDTNRTPWSLEFTTVNSPECFSFAYTHSLRFKPYWKGTYLDISVTLDSFVQRKAIYPAVSELSLDAQAYLLKIFDPKKTFDLVQKWQDNEDTQKPELVCLPTDPNCADFLSLWSIKVDLPSDLSATTKKAIQEMTSHQLQLDKKLFQTVSGSEGLVMALREVRAKRLELDRVHALAFMPYLLTECGNPSFKGGTFVGYDLKELRDASCRSKEAITKVLREKVTHQGKNPFEWLSSLGTAPDKSIEALGEKIRANIFEESRLTKQLMSLVMSRPKPDSHFFFASNHLLLPPLTRKPVMQTDYAYALMPINGQAPQTKDTSVSVRNNKFNIDVNPYKRAGDDKTLIKGLNLCESTHQQGQSISLEGVLPLAYVGCPIFDTW